MNTSLVETMKINHYNAIPIKKKNNARKHEKKS